MRTRLGAAAVGLTLLGTILATRADHGYAVEVLMPSATNVVAGGPVLMNGFKAGSVTSLKVEDGKALVGLKLDGDFVPLHQGATVVVSWKAALSERNVEVVDGPKDKPEIPDGGRITGPMPKAMEVDDILAALDAPTRQRLQGVVAKLATTLDGHEQDLQGTLGSAGPTVEALGQILRALGTDGPAMRNLVRRLDEMLATLAERDQQVERITGSFARLTTQVSARRQQVSSSLEALPGTLRQARKTLDLVPSVVAETVPLLRDLQPATARLRPVARSLRPLLADLAPLTADLQPTLVAAQQLLGLTPGLLDSTHATLPGVAAAITAAQAPVRFLRPYTPEAVGFLSTWASAFSNYGSDGNFARIIPQAGLSTPTVNPGVLPPGVTYDPYPVPGAVVGQAWTDAFGSDVR
jgi:phospholipid/cholesterol/gamma-HCH transport system substrate-binding protein